MKKIALAAAAALALAGMSPVAPVFRASSRSHVYQRERHPTKGGPGRRGCRIKRRINRTKHCVVMVGGRQTIRNRKKLLGTR